MRASLTSFLISPCVSLTSPANLEQCEKQRWVVNLHTTVSILLIFSTITACTLPDSTPPAAELESRPPRPKVPIPPPLSAGDHPPPPPKVPYSAEEIFGYC